MWKEEQCHPTDAHVLTQHPRTHGLQAQLLLETRLPGETGISRYLKSNGVFAFQSKGRAFYETQTRSSLCCEDTVCREVTVAPPRSQPATGRSFPEDLDQKKPLNL